MKKTLIFLILLASNLANAQEINDSAFFKCYSYLDSAINCQESLDKSIELRNTKYCTRKVNKDLLVLKFIDSVQMTIDSSANIHNIFTTNTLSKLKGVKVYLHSDIRTDHNSGIIIDTVQTVSLHAGYCEFVMQGSYNVTINPKSKKTSIYCDVGGGDENVFNPYYFYMYFSNFSGISSQTQLKLHIYTVDIVYKH